MSVVASSGAPKTRLDQLLVDRGLADNRTRAQALVLAGRVTSGSTPLAKPGVRYSVDIEISVREGRRWVGRGARKLLGALDAFGIQTRDRIAIDVGSSTGGFTQVLLESGAKRVISVDVGRGQLDWGLRNDPRVVVMEGVNARYLSPDQISESPSLAVMDVSFISVERILPALAGCMREDGEIISLIKPQFEVGRGHVGKGGIVRDPALHREVLTRIVHFVRAAGWSLRGLCRSPITGTDGNREFFIHIELVPGASGLEASDLSTTITDLCESGEKGQ